MEAVSVFPWMFFFALGGGVGLPLGVPPLPEDPVLACLAPEECLVYFASAGQATPLAKSPNQTEQLLAEPEVRQLVAGVERLIRAELAKAGKRQSIQGARQLQDAADLGQTLLQRPWALSVSKVKIIPGSFPDIRASAAINVGTSGDKVKAALERFQAELPPGSVKPVIIDGTTYQQITFPQKGPELTWGIKGPYLYVGLGQEELEVLLKRVGGTAPKWLTDLRKQLPVERVSTVSMVNLKGVISLAAPLAGPQFSGVLEATGLDGVERLMAVTGLDKEHFISRSLLTLQGEPKGLLQQVSVKPLTTDDLAILPRDATFAAAGKVDLDKLYTSILNIVEKIEPKAAMEIRTGLARAERELGVSLVDDVLKALGDTIAVFDSPAEGGMFTGITAVVSLRDAQRAAATHQKLLGVLESVLKRQGEINVKPPIETAPGTPFAVPPEGAVERKRGPGIEKLSFAGKTIYILNAGKRDFFLAPSWCLTDKYLIVALYPQAIKGFLSRGRMFPPLTKVPAVAAALEGEGGILKMTYVDTQRIFDLVYPLLPLGAQALATELQRQGINLNVGLLPSARAIRRHLLPAVMTARRTPAGIEVTARQTLPGGPSLTMAPVAVGLLLPAVQKVREAAARTQSMNNLKQIGLAMHVYHDALGTFPPAYKADKDGKPLLSWRVLILPYIEQQALYQQFHLDEPWDSPHNIKLSKVIIPTYRSPGSHAAPGLTNYLTVRGKDTAFPGSKGIRMVDLTDGSSNTIMVVEVSDRKAVPWTKPDDFDFNEQNPGDGLRGLWPQGFLAAFCDGSVRIINATNPKGLKSLFLRNDGKSLPRDY